MRLPIKLLAKSNTGLTDSKRHQQLLFHFITALLQRIIKNAKSDLCALGVFSVDFSRLYSFVVRPSSREAVISCNARNTFSAVNGGPGIRMPTAS
jgi:hypothetical protein